MLRVIPRGSAEELCGGASLTQWLTAWLLAASLAGSGFDWQNKLASDSKRIPTDLFRNHIHMSSCKDKKLPSI